jgi:long-chain fatty acid transport protein
MEMQRHRVSLFLALVASFAFVPGRAEAQAFGLNEIGTCAFSRGMSATSAPCNDASSIFWNPAALAGLTGNSILVGAAAISIEAKFTRDSALGSHEGDVPLQVVPHLFLNATRGNKSFGLGVYVPYGLTSQWKDDFPGRFLASKASIASIYIQPNFAMSFKQGRWMIGGGPVFGHSNVELIQAADLADQIARVDSTTVPGTRNIIRFSNLGIGRRTEFARATLEGSANSLGLNVGVLGKLNENWTFGLRYLSSLMMEYDDAEATFEQKPTGIVFAANNPLGYPAGTQFDTLATVRSRFCADAGSDMPAPFGGSAQTCAAAGLLGPQTVSTRIAHPDQFQVGFSYRGFPSWMVAVDYEWTGWRKFRELPVNFSRDTLPSANPIPQPGDPCPATGAPLAGPCDFDILDRELLEDYNNTSAIRIGAERTMQNGWLLRLGFAGVASAAPDETVTPLLPEQDRSYWTLGTAIPVKKDRVTLDAAYGYVMGAGKRGRIDERLLRSQTATSLNSGVFDLSAHVFSFSLKATF